MQQLNLVLVHIGQNLPEYIFDCIYQCLLINGPHCKIYVVVDECHIDDIIQQLFSFNLNVFVKYPVHVLQNVVQVIPISIPQKLLDEDNAYNSFVDNARKHADTQFREGFWVSTTSRFFYIYAVTKLFHLKNVFHIENDIMLYVPFKDIFDETICKDPTKTWMVQDAPNRVVPSILFFPNMDNLKKLVEFITQQHNITNRFQNDMDILGKFPEKECFPLCDNSIVYDGAAIGQYLGGIDLRNVIQNPNDMNYYNNKTIGFINETCVFKPNTCIFTRKNIVTDEHHGNLKTILLFRNQQVSRVANLHIHSKQLYQFSSIHDISFKDIISGDRILSLCDFVIATSDILNFHKGIEHFAKDIILVKDWNKINIYKLNEYFRQHSKNTNNKTIKLFIYTHTLHLFCKFILDKLDKKLSYVLYLHNSDHPFDIQYKHLLNNECIKSVYSQNIDYPEDNSKLFYLPIGIANAMWKHGNLQELYKVIKNTFKKTKTKSIYVNINASTFGYRKLFLEKIKEKNTYPLTDSKPYKDYLNDLSQHRFCLCLRGNGVDTHRFWESLYLGVIPVIVNNKDTKCKNYVNYMKKQVIPFVEITENDLDIILDKYTEDYFNEELYLKFMEESNLFTLETLKLSFYKE